MTIEEVCVLLEKASTLKIHELSFDGLRVVFDFPPHLSTLGSLPLKPEQFSAQDKVYGEIKAEDILKPPAHLDNLSSEEILFAATPYFDELQANKEAHQEKLKNDAI